MSVFAHVSAAFERTSMCIAAVTSRGVCPGAYFTLTVFIAGMKRITIPYPDGGMNTYPSPPQRRRRTVAIPNHFHRTCMNGSYNALLVIRKLARSL